MQVIDFFCGMGGASLGYKHSGCDVVLAIDKWDSALQTHAYNLKEIPVLNCDIENLNLDMLPDADIYHLSPPCQSFSTAGKQEGFNSVNGNLFIVTLNILKYKRPNVFVIENVKGLLNHVKKNDALFDGFDEYNITPMLVNAKDCGVCQSRERVFIVGVKKNFGKFVKPSPVPNNQTFNDVIIAVANNNYGLPSHSASLLNKIKHIPQGGCILDIPASIRPKGFKNSYGRLCINQIPPTITRNYNCPSSANCIHPIEDRGLSDAEALYIQGFPENWQVQGATKSLQIGNAVPPKMIEWVMQGLTVFPNNKQRGSGLCDII